MLFPIVGEGGANRVASECDEALRAQLVTVCTGSQIIGATDTQQLLSIESFAATRCRCRGTCVGHIGKLFGARVVIAGWATRVGASLLLTLSLLDVHEERRDAWTVATDRAVAEGIDQVIDTSVRRMMKTAGLLGEAARLADAEHGDL